MKNTVGPTQFCQSLVKKLCLKSNVEPSGISSYQYDHSHNTSKVTLIIVERLFPNFIEATLS